MKHGHRKGKVFLKLISDVQPLHIHCTDNFDSFQFMAELTSSPKGKPRDSGNSLS